MLGAAIGDIVGSIYEWDNIKTKDFTFLTEDCFFTDDTVMTFAILKAILMSNKNLSDLYDKTVEYMQYYGRKYPNRGYGGHFDTWIYCDNPKPYNSWGNGAPMRVSAAGFCADSLTEALKIAEIVTITTHNHPQGIKGAKATAACIYLARTGSSMEDIKQYISNNYYKDIKKLDDIRDTYKFDVSTQGTMPVALEAFFESVSFEDAIRNAISVGGDSDTIAAITGSIAQAFYGIPKDLEEEILENYLPNEFVRMYIEYKEKYCELC